MKIRLHEIGDEPYTWDVDERVPAAALDRDELLELSPIAWSGRIDQLDSGYLLRARLAYDQTLACQRCLAKVTEPVDEELELLLLPHESGAEEEERELEEKDLGVVVVDDDELDLQPILLEQLQLNVPMRPLCREDCAGLCPTCGADLNQGRCDCVRETVDPRWAGLVAIRDRLDEGRRD
jgi:uncharacterized protein